MTPGQPTSSGSDGGVADAEDDGTGGQDDVSGQDGAGGQDAAITAPFAGSDEPPATGSDAPELPPMASPTSGTSGECSPEELCMVIPGAWHGPGIIIEGTPGTPANCPAQFSANVDSVFSAMGEPQGGCRCTCAPSGVGCEDSTVLRIYDTQAQCGNLTSSFPQAITASRCTPLNSLDYENTALHDPEDNLSSLLTRDYFAVEAAGITGGSCQADVSETFQPVEFQQQLSLCAAGVGSACADSSGQCVASEALCIWRDGDVPCAGDFTDRVVYHRQLSDTRACGTCNCGSVTGDCPVTVDFLEYNDGECVPWNVSVSSGESCVGSGTRDIERFNATIGPPDVRCSGAGSSAVTGTVTPSTPVTVCCRPVQ